jgi:uncharacterized protein
VLSNAERRAALQRARRAIARAVGVEWREDPEPTGEKPPVFSERRGVFVTLKLYPHDRLRGCIGYPLPVLPLGQAIDQAAIAAATEDPRFRAVRAPEFPNLVVEISVLTVPETIRARSPAEIVAAVQVGRDGLIVERPGASGLLLPQVAPEQGWSAEEFLDGTCEKAGLPAGAWRRPDVRVQRFEAEIFGEASPGGGLAEESKVTPDGARTGP